MIFEDSKESSRGALTKEMAMLEIFPGKPMAPQRKASRLEIQQFSLVAFLPNLSLNSTGQCRRPRTQ